MTKRKRMALVASITAVLCVPAVFAIAHAAEGNGANDVNTATHDDPDPATDPRQEYEALNKAQDEGNAAAEKSATEAMRDEILSRVTPEQREAAEATAQQPHVPAGTHTYIPPSMPKAVVERCEAEIKEREEPLCELIVLHAEGKVRSGAFTLQEQSEALRGAE